jgi:FHA domain
MVKICPACLYSNDKGVLACTQCGQGFAQVQCCDDCGSTRFEFSTFCYHCGVLLQSENPLSTSVNSDPEQSVLRQEDCLATTFHGKGIRLFHRSSTTFIELPVLKVAILGKGNSSFQPDIDLGNFPDAEFISRSHARIYLRERQYYIEDLDSKNGTELNGVVLLEGQAQVLSVGDQIRLGGSDSLTFVFVKDQPINFEHLKLISGEDAAFEAELLTSFLGSVGNILATLDSAVESGSFAEVRSLGNQITITSYNVGADIMNLLGKQLEDQALQQSTLACRKTLTLLNEGLAQVRLFLKVFYGSQFELASG